MSLVRLSVERPELCAQEDHSRSVEATSRPLGSKIMSHSLGPLGFKTDI